MTFRTMFYDSLQRIGIWFVNCQDWQALFGVREFFANFFKNCFLVGIKFIFYKITKLNICLLSPFKSVPFWQGLVRRCDPGKRDSGRVLVVVGHFSSSHFPMDVDIMIWVVVWHKLQDNISSKVTNSNWITMSSILSDR